MNKCVCEGEMDLGCVCECGGVVGIGSKSMCVFERRVMSTASRSFLSASQVKELFFPPALNESVKRHQSAERYRL